MDIGKAYNELYYEPNDDTVEARPNVLYVGHSKPRAMHQPHWHAQVEINYMMRGHMDYRIGRKLLRVTAGQMLLFWGGMAHQSLGSSDDGDYVVIHLPLMYFFRMRLQPALQAQLMRGSSIISNLNDPADFTNFGRWADYLRFGTEAMVENALDEVLLRCERLQFGDYEVAGSGQDAEIVPETADNALQGHIARMCAYIGQNFREEISVTDIAYATDLHPKYAMNIFKKSTGMTLNKYVCLLRLSYAQAMLMKDDISVVDVAMDAGFGSLSAFNKSFQKLAGKSPSNFRRDSHARPTKIAISERDYGRA